jgi:hypothetical protein
MRLLRVKFTILSLMLAVAVAALLLTSAVRMHPQPAFVWIQIPESELGALESAAASGPSRIPHPASGYEILWSDGSRTKLGDDAPIPRCNGGEPFAFGFLRRVEWYDRTSRRLTSYTWHTSWPSEQIQDLCTTFSPCFWGFLRFATHANVIFIILNVLLWTLVYQKIAERRVEASLRIRLGCIVSTWRSLLLCVRPVNQSPSDPQADRRSPSRQSTRPDTFLDADK